MTTVPTIGFNVETLSYKNIKFQVWDLGGQTSIRPYWRCYYPNTDAIIFVVDSTDVERLELAKTELFQLLEVRAFRRARPAPLPPPPPRPLTPPSRHHRALLPLQEDELKEATLLIMANKQDMKGALKANQLSDALNLAVILNRQWSIIETSATQGKGLFDGFDWLVQCQMGKK